MPAAFAPLVVIGGCSALYCPATGRAVFHPKEGFDSSAAQSPHVRFVVDGLGDIWVVDPSQLPEGQAQYQRKLVEVLKADADALANQNAMIDACAAVMPESALVLELLDPPQGSYDGEITYVGFDFAKSEDDAFPSSVMLSPLGDIRGQCPTDQR